VKLGEIIKTREHTDILRSDATNKEQMQKEKKEAIQHKIQSVQARLQNAERDVERAQAECDRLRFAPVALEPSVLEEIEMMTRAIPVTAPPTKSKPPIW
jgi:molecular chaperone GrpE (heat shock protein)